METDDLLLYLQQPATGPFHVPGESNPRHYITFLTLILVSTFHLLYLCLPWGLVPSDFLTETLYGFIYLLPHACHRLNPPHSPRSDHPNHKLGRFQYSG